MATWSEEKKQLHVHLHNPFQTAFAVENCEDPGTVPELLGGFRIALRGFSPEVTLRL